MSFFGAIFHPWCAEMHKLLARKRTHIGLVSFLGLQLILLLVIHLKGLGPMQRFLKATGGNADYYFSALTVAGVILSTTSFLLGSLNLALIGGDAVAKEVEDGVMRLLLARPVGRFRLLLVKYLACLCFAVLLYQFMGWSAWMLGSLLCGLEGGFCAWMPGWKQACFFPPEEGMWRYAQAIFALPFFMMPIASLAFFFSCCRMKPATASVLALSWVLMDNILINTDLLQEPRSHFWLVTDNMENWILLWWDQPDWGRFKSALGVVAGLNLALFTLGYVVFASRDLKS
jgi:ABC-2 type transport system permease protein